MEVHQIVAALITEDVDVLNEHYAAVAIVQRDDKWLLGLSKSEDDRRNHWCFPGGGIKGGEEPPEAAERECREETGVRCRAVGPTVTLPGKRGVAFVRCRHTGGQLRPNHEFSALGWFSRREMGSLKLYGNVLKLIDRVT